MVCKDLMTCPQPVTNEYFKRVCNTKIWMNCHHYAKQHGGLKKPVEWLQKLAIEQERLRWEESLFHEEGREEKVSRYE